MNPRNRHVVRRRGAALIILIAVFAVVMGLAAVWTRQILLERQRVRRIEQRAQAGWLAEAGLRRAAARLVRDAAYQGETWSIAANELNQRNGGEVAIAVERPQLDDGAPQADAYATESRTRFLIKVRARYPEGKSGALVAKQVEFTPTTEPAL
jgi:Tfp pilus assembly protein PilX